MNHKAGKYKGRKNWDGINRQGKKNGCLFALPAVATLLLRLLYRKWKG